jgi:hypothetical protein
MFNPSPLYAGERARVRGRSVMAHRCRSAADSSQGAQSSRAPTSPGATPSLDSPIRRRPLRLAPAAPQTRSPPDPPPRKLGTHRGDTPGVFPLHRCSTARTSDSIPPAHSHRAPSPAPARIASSPPRDRRPVPRMPPRAAIARMSPQGAASPPHCSSREPQGAILGQSRGAQKKNGRLSGPPVIALPPIS